MYYFTIRTRIFPGDTNRPDELVFQQDDGEGTLIGSEVTIPKDDFSAPTKIVLTESGLKLIG
jgi:hypothetical protein